MGRALNDFILRINLNGDVHVVLDAGKDHMLDSPHVSSLDVISPSGSGLGRATLGY
jgi:hypothetical protein